MSIFRHNLNILVVFGFVSMLLILSACYSLTEPASGVNALVVSPVKTEVPCQECDQETAAAANAIEQNNLEQQALATAKIVGANAQATLDSVNATLNAAQTRRENDASILEAQIAATAELALANAKATLVAAGSTQSAALTQDSIEQTRVQYNQQISADLATEDAIVILTQQYYSYLIANQNATETQSAGETLQSYAVEANQLEEQRQATISFIWMLCLPVFLLLFAGLGLWGFWRWLKMQPESLAKVQQGRSSPNLKRGRLENRFRVPKPDHSQVSRWLNEVKNTLLTSGWKDRDDNAD